MTEKKLKNSLKKRIIEWIEKHPKQVLIGMVVMLFLSLLMLIIGQINRINNKPKAEDDPLRSIKETTQKVGKTTKTSYGAIVDVHELYQNAKAIMQKDSLTAEDIAYLRRADSTLTSIIKMK